MSLQLHLHEGKCFPIGPMSVANPHAQRRHHILWDSVAQEWLRLYKLRSPWPNLLGYTKLVNLTACLFDKKFMLLPAGGRRTADHVGPAYIIT